MHLLTVYAHPFGDRYPAAVMDAFHRPFRDGGHSLDVLDLHAEGFDPRFTREDHAHFWGGPLPDEIAAMHRRVERADRLAFAYCGITDVASHLIVDVEGDHNAPARDGLRRAVEIGQAFLAPDRIVGNAKEEHLRSHRS